MRQGGATGAGSGRGPVQQAGYREYQSPYGNNSNEYRLAWVRYRHPSDVVDQLLGADCPGPKLARLIADDLDGRSWDADDPKYLVETISDLAHAARKLGLTEKYLPQITLSLNKAFETVDDPGELDRALDIAAELNIDVPAEEALAARVLELAATADHSVRALLTLAERLKVRGRAERILRERVAAGGEDEWFERQVKAESNSLQSHLWSWTQADSKAAARTALYRALSHRDLPERLQHELALEAAATAATVYTGGAAQDPTATERLTHHLAEHAQYLSSSLAENLSVTEMLADSTLRHLLARLIRHELNMRSIREAGAGGRASRAEKLFVRSWERKIVGTAAARGRALPEGRDMPPFTPERICCAGSTGNAPTIRKKEAQPGGTKALRTPKRAETARWADGCRCTAGPEGDSGTLISESCANTGCGNGCRCTAGPEGDSGTLISESCADPSCRAGRSVRVPRCADTGYIGQPCGREQQPAAAITPASRARAAQIVAALSGRRPTRQLCDQLAAEAWSDGPLLLAVLKRQRELPDRLLAAIKRASLTTGDHLNPNPPVTAAQLCAELGSEKAAELLVRLQRVRVQWDARQKPPRYLRYDRTRIEWRSAARFLAKDGAEAARLVEHGCGEDLHPEAARTLLRLGRLHLLWLSGEWEHVVLAAAGYDAHRMIVAHKAASQVPDGSRWRMLAAVLCGEIDEKDVEVVAKLSETWDMGKP
jgi:hypothetical protein